MAPKMQTTISRHFLLINGTVSTSIFFPLSALPHIGEGESTTFDVSINPSVGHPELVEYTATKGAIVGRSLGSQLVSPTR